MPRVPSVSGGTLPRWLIVAGSAAILFHLAAIIIPTLDVRSGPWSKPMLPGERSEPEFAHAAAGLSALHAEYLRNAPNFDFVSNKPGDIPGVRLEAILRDKDGTLVKTLSFPDADANPWVRHRQEILVRWLAPDQPVASPRSDVIPPSGQNPEVAIWALEDEQFPPPPDYQPPTSSKAPLVLRQVPEHLVPRMRGQVWGPNEVSMVMVHSYVRYLCRTYGAASVELVRYTREPVSYSVLLPNGGVSDIEEVKASYGRMSE